MINKEKDKSNISFNTNELYLPLTKKQDFKVTTHWYQVFNLQHEKLLKTSFQTLMFSEISRTYKVSETFPLIFLLIWIFAQ